MVSGVVVYGPEPLEKPADGNLLVCCSQPVGDIVVDFNPGDVLHFAGFGAGTFLQVGATNQWQITSALDAHVETITIANGAILTPADVLFL